MGELNDNVCPVCGQNHIEYEDLDFMDRKVKVYYYCMADDCDATWTSTYKLSEIELDEYN